MSLLQELTYVIRKLNRKEKKGNLSFVTNLRQKGNSNKCAKLLTAAPGNSELLGGRLAVNILFQARVLQNVVHNRRHMVSQNIELFF